VIVASSFTMTGVSLRRMSPPLGLYGRPCLGGPGGELCPGHRDPARHGPAHDARGVAAHLRGVSLDAAAPEGQDRRDQQNGRRRDGQDMQVRVMDSTRQARAGPQRYDGDPGRDPLRDRQSRQPQVVV